MGYVNRSLLVKWHLQALITSQTLLHSYVGAEAMQQDGMVVGRALIMPGLSNHGGKQ